MLYMLGPVLLSIAPLNATDLSKEGLYPYAEHAVLGTAPVYENMGEGERTRTLSGVTFPHVEEFASGITSVGVLEEIRRNGQPVHLIRGDMVPQGWFLITSLSEEHKELDFFGVPKHLTFEIKLVQTSSPSASSFLSIFGAFL